ncbi:hypothetical protein MG293_003677 [Ovis ammon polii]|uniref:Uncharacterized protein n=1 Tax=Ovis ammon polii TaxID=230172 RepID=A0AAD4YH79_OVIAM|nr:hypothetical protein MG293_003677 [Ovis ammon polii]
MEAKVLYESPTGTNHAAENFGEVLCLLWLLCCCVRTGDRDDYDKKVKQAAKEKARRRHTPAPTRPRKPDLQVYLPRHRDGSTHPSNPDCEESGESSSSGSSEPEPPGHQLFCLEYEADSGDITSVIVYQDDDPGRVSEEVSAHTPLEPLMREALKLRIQEEIAKRQSRH